MRFLLITPKWARTIGEYYDFPLGIAYISSTLKSNGHEVHCLNLNHTIQSVMYVVASHVKKLSIDVVCVGGGCTDFNQVNTILTAAKQTNPHICTICGGGLFSCEPELMLRSLPINIGVLNEGEATIAELANALKTGRDFSLLDGIAFLDSRNNYVENRPREPIAELDSIPFPDFSGFLFDEYLDSMKPNDMYYLNVSDNPRPAPMISSRSCPYSCTFCYHPLGNKYRTRSMNNFFDELDLLVSRHRINIVAIYDELFSINKKKTLEFCERIKPYRLNWIPQMRVSDIDADILKAMKESGCHYISYGIESADDRVLQSMKKHITVAEIDQALELTRSHKIGIQGNLIFGDPAETVETLTNSVNWWHSHAEFQINLSLVIAYPRSPLYLMALEKGKLKNKLHTFQTNAFLANLTKFSDEDFSSISNMLSELRQNIRLFADVILITATNFDKRRGFLYTLVIKCPHCKSTVTYHNLIVTHHDFNPAMGVYKLACRSCNQRFDLPHGLFQGRANALNMEFQKEIRNILRQGELALESGLHHEALAICQALVHDFPLLDVGYLAVAIVAAKLSKYELVDEALQATATLPLKNHEPFKRLERCFQQGCDLITALELLKREWSWGETSLIV